MQVSIWGLYEILHKKDNLPSLEVVTKGGSPFEQSRFGLKKIGQGRGPVHAYAHPLQLVTFMNVSNLGADIYNNLLPIECSAKNFDENFCQIRNKNKFSSQE